ncbi:MAG TPA: bifunctional phosphopantothenoylcysteine decarboxylase/phosphopantothenate--cysteine ligase CoaBC [Rubricoccaceae bacterium]
MPLAGPASLGAAPLAGAKIVLGVSGSIAAYKAAELVRALGRAGAAVQPVMTPAATRFIPALTLSVLAGRETLVDLFPDGDRGDEGAAASAWTKHVELGLWADAVVVAPATAQTMATLAHGFCDSMLAAVVLSARCPVLVAPAMDHDMWHHPATQRNVARLRTDGVHIVEPAEGPLASGLVGQGRLPEPDALVAEITRWLAEHRARSAPDRSLAGRTVLVTAGPTREAADPVRFLSNGSTGTMGFEIAAAAARRGATVTLLAGPVALDTPPGVTRIDVVTADDLLREALAHGAADLVIAAAAVSDYAPADVSTTKLTKTDGELIMRLRRTPDVLAALGAQKRPGQTLVGFALETHDGEAHACAKLARKNLDWIALNAADVPGEGFGTGTNRLALLSADGRRVDVPLGSKRAVAEALLDAVTAPAVSATAA